MGIPESDWSQPNEPRRSSRFNSVGLLVALSLLFIALVALRWERLSHEELSSRARVSDIKLSLLPGLPKLTIRQGSLYPANDPWTGYLASEQTCPGGERTDLPLGEQANVMVCLINYARQQEGLSTLTPESLLNETSLKKAGKIVRCNEFAHGACGDDPAADVRAANYYGSWGENLYLGEGRLGAPRVALDGWLNSPEHRENLFNSNWRYEGIAVMTAAQIGEYSRATVWVNQFGEI
ncbi:MAG: CAP domain-containing protein [Gaiellaceae bacterium]